MANVNSKFEQFFAKKDGVKKTKSTGLGYFKFEKQNTLYRLRALPIKGSDYDGMPVASRHYHAVNTPSGEFISISCPQKTSGDRCPFCAAASALWKEHVNTGSIEKKEAAKALFAKTEYIAIVAAPEEMAKLTGAPTIENLRILTIGSKTNRELVDGRLQRGHDFADFTSGRDLLMKKVSGSGTGTITLEFDDAEEAFSGDRALYEQLEALVPDVTSMLVADEAAVNDAFQRFTAAPTITTSASTYVEVIPPVTSSYADEPTSTGAFDIEELRRQMSE